MFAEPMSLVEIHWLDVTHAVFNVMLQSVLNAYAILISQRINRGMRRLSSNNTSTVLSAWHALTN